MDLDSSCDAIANFFQKFVEEKCDKNLVVGFSSDDEEDVEEFIGRLKDTLTELELDQTQLKKIHLLILLNSDFGHVNLLEEDNNFCHVLNVLPKISKYLYFQIVTQMKWQNYLQEVVLNFPEVIVYEIVESIYDNLKYICLDCALAFFYSLMDGLFIKILNIQNVCKYRTQKFVKLFELLIVFKIEDLLNETDWETYAKYQYLGYTVRMYLDMVESCIQKLIEHKFVPDPFYLTNVNYTYTQWGATSSSLNWGYYCLRFLATRAVEIVKTISVDIYISWMEVEVKDAVGKTLQMSVRETAFVCQEALRTIKHLYDAIPGLAALDNCLASISVKPVTEDEEIKEADANTIVMNLLNPKRTQIKWLRGLIEKGVFQNATFMKVVADNASLMDYDTVLLLTQNAFDYLTTNSVEDVKPIRDTVVLSIRSLKESDQILLLTRVCELYGNKDPLLGEDFDSRVTDFFNKLVRNDDNKKQESCIAMVSFAIESRESLLSRALEECLTSETKASIILDLVQHVSPICLVISESQGLPLILTNVLSILDLVKNAPEKTRDNFIHLLKTLGERKLMNPSSLFYDWIVPRVEKCHLEQDWMFVNFYLDLIEVLEQLVRPRTVKFISIIAKTLNALRPRVKTFKSEHVEIAEKCISILISSVRNITRAKTAEDEEISQLRSLGANLSPLTWQYMQPLWNNWGRELPPDEHGLLSWTQTGFGHGDSLATLEEEIRLRLVTTTVKILPQLTPREWERIGGVNLKNIGLAIATYKVVADCILVLFQVPFMLKNMPLLGHNVTNFLNFSQKIIIPRLKLAKEDELEDVIEKLDQIAEQLPEELSKSKMPDLLRLKNEASSKDVEQPMES